MTFLQLQDAVMNSLNLTSTDARTRIKAELNLRYREVQSAVNLAQSRRGIAIFTTTSGETNVTQSGIAKVFSVFDPTNLQRPLGEISLQQLRQMDAPSLVKGNPYLYVVSGQTNDISTLSLFPQPQSTIVLQADVLKSGVDMVDDTDEPAFSVDFHDVLVHGVRYDELLKMEKLRPLAVESERKFQQRLSELRYFLAKSAYLHLKQTDQYARFGLSARVWPYSNMVP